MTIAQVISSLPSSGNIDKALLRSAILSGLAHFIAPDVDPQTVDPVDVDTGSKPWLIGWQEKLWWFDPLDSTTAHDAVSCIVLDGGYRYKVSVVDPWHGYSVKSADLTTPPDPDDSPSQAYGDAWLVPSGASGDWGDHADDIAVWTARGWEYVQPRFGRLLYVEDQSGYVHYTAAGAWEEGLGNNAHAVASIAPDKLVQGLKNWVVQEIGTNNPPSIVKGINYIVGSAPTGAFVGHENEVVTSDDGSTLNFYTPAEGWTAYSIADHTDYRFDGTTWRTGSGFAVTAVFSVTGFSGSNIPGQPSSVDTSADTVTWSTAHGLTTGDVVKWDTAAAALPGGLTASVPYYVRAISATIIAFYTSKVAALADSGRVNLTSSFGTPAGNHSIARLAGIVEDKTFGVDSVEIVGGVENQFLLRFSEVFADTNYAVLPAGVSTAVGSYAYYSPPHPVGKSVGSVIFQNGTVFQNGSLSWKDLTSSTTLQFNILIAR